VTDIHPAAPDEIGYYSHTRTNNASDINLPFINVLNILFEEYFEKLF